MSFRICMLAALVLGIPASAAAQAPATTLDGLGTIARSREKVTVTDTQGKTIRGRLASISMDALEIIVDDRPVRLEALQVDRVTAKRPDSILNGMIGGFLAGAAAGAVLALSGGNGYLDERDFVAPMALLGGAIGLGVGTAIDASLKKRHVLYERPRAGGTARLTIGPMVERGGVGVLAVLRP